MYARASCIMVGTAVDVDQLRFFQNEGDESSRNALGSQLDVNIDVIDTYLTFVASQAENLK